MLEQNNTSDTLMWDIWTSIYHLSALTAADELGLFTYLINHECDINSLASKLNTNLHAISTLVDFLICFGFLQKNDDKIKLTPTAENYLTPTSPFYWGPVLTPFREKDEHKKIISAIKQGNTQLIFKNKSFTDMWQDGSITPEAARVFTQKMHATIFAPALEAIKSDIFISTKKLLDVGGGSGCFSIGFTQRYRERTATVFELPAVGDITDEYIKQYNAMQNVSVHTGNFFIKDDWPTNCDGILLSQIVHDWPVEKCKQILSNAYNALPSGGKIYIHEMLLEDKKTSPMATVCFNLLMLINHQSQQFTEKLLSELLQSCGFSDPKTIPTFGYFSITTATKV